MTSNQLIPRVVVATNMYPTDGDPSRGAFVKAQVDALKELGLPVHVFHLRGDVSSLNYLRAISELRSVVESFKADLVYAFYGLTGWVALWQRAPIVLSLAGDDVLGTSNGRGGVTAKSLLGIALTQWAAWRASIVCVQSEEMRNRMWNASLRRRSLVIAYGVDPRRFCPGDQASARRRLGIPIEALVVIFPNTPNEPRKRLDIAEAAMSLVRRELPNACLKVVARVPHDEMPDYYRAADCCLLTSDWEGSPNVIKEALLSGVPVVTTDVGDVRRWVPLSQESSIAERTAEAFAREITIILRERRRVDPSPFIAAFSSQVVARQMLRLFRDAVAHPD